MWVADVVTEDIMGEEVRIQELRICEVYMRNVKLNVAINFTDITKL